MALPNNTYASPGVSFYAPAGESAKNWYQFPALNGTIQLVDASGTQLLRSIDGDLFYNNELLAKASDIQDVADWSLYPALQSVELAGQDIIQANNITAASTITANVLDASSATITGAVSANSLATVPGPFTSGDVKTQTVTASGLVSAGSVSSSGLVSAGSVSSTGNIQGTSLTTTGGLDMANTAITRASAVNISANGFAPYGALSSPDGTLLTWNGATINTGGAGSASNWANYPAVTNINANTNNINNAGTVTAFAFNGTNVEATNISAGTTGSGKFMVLTNNSITGSSTDGITVSLPYGNLSTTVLSGNISNTAIGITNAVSNNYDITADAGINPLVAANVNMTAKNGNGGKVNITADPGSIAAFGGSVNITANGGTVYVPRPPPDPPLPVTVGGEVNITANTGGGLYTLTSAINLSAAGINSYAGAIPPFGSLAGYNFIYGTGGVSLCAGLPASGVQFPGTTYIYGIGIPGVAGGVRLQSPQGIQMLSDTYIENLYPLDGNGLTIQGRSLPTGYVTILDCAKLSMTSGGAGILTDKITSVSGNGLFYADNFYPATNTQGIYAKFLKPPQASAPGVPNLVISNNPFLANTNYVQISGADTIAFDATGTGALTGLQSINGAAWPPPTGDASLWSQYVATSPVNISSFGLTNVSSLTGVSTINGIPYDPNDTALWATYPAVQNVDLSGNELLNANDVHFIAGATILGAGALNADVAGDLSFFTSGGGEINLSTRNLASINITTLGAGNDVNVSGDTVALNAIQGVNVLAPALNMLGNDISGVGTINGVGGTTELKIQNTGTGSTSILDLSGGVFIASQFAPVTINGGTRVQLNTNTGPINLLPQGGAAAVNLLGDTVVGTVPVPQNLTVNGTITATGTMKSASITDAALSVGTANQVLTAGAAGSSLTWSSAAGLSFIYDNTIFVDPNGSDVTGNGGISNPYQTLTQAINVRNSLPDTTEISIFVASGTYNESPTITKSNTFLCGFNSSGANKNSVNIIGTITVSITATTSGTTQIVFSDFQITGQISFPQATNVNQPTQYSFENINFINNGNNYMILMLNAGGNYDPTKVSTFNNCVFNNSGTFASLNIQRTTATITNSQFINTLTGPCIICNFAAIIYARNSSFINTSSSTNCQTLINFQGSYTTTTLFPSIENCVLRYLSSAVDVGGNKCCVQFAGNSAYESQIYNNTMYCEGATTGGAQPQAVQKTGTGLVTVKQFGNDCGLTAHHIAPAITQITGRTLT
jgi:hypothetical protein